MSTKEDYESRLALLASARALVQALETPRETMIKHIWAQPSVQVSLALLYEAGLFHAMAKNDKPMTVVEYAEAINLDPKLLGMIYSFRLDLVRDPPRQSTNVNTNVGSPPNEASRIHGLYKGDRGG